MRQVYLPSEKKKRKPCRAAGYIQRPFAYQDVLPLVQKHSQHGAREHAEESFGGRRRGMGTFFETARRRRIQSIPGLLGPPFPTHRNNTTTSIPSSSPRKKKGGGVGLALLFGRVAAAAASLPARESVRATGSRLIKCATLVVRKL